MNFERSAGILLHPTSLPGKFGIGDLGKEAYKFVDFLESAGQKLWQVFPLGPTGYGDSPYQCFSAFAGNPLLISPELLVKENLLSENDLENIPQFNPHQVDFGNLINYKKLILKTAFDNFIIISGEAEKDFKNFVKEEKDWLEDFSLFMALKDFHNGELWAKWDENLVLRKKKSLDEFSIKLKSEILYHKFVQYYFFKQWKNLKKYANDKGIKIIGDLPIFIAYDSSDCWANKKLFSVDEKGKLLTVAGVPPDYFSPTGQLWGNPLYNWNEMEKDDFHWWRKRISSLLKMVDIIRIDHFRGFEAYWEISGDAVTAENGKWVKAPGDKFFTIINNYLGDIPILAEDLGLITKEVNELRDKFNFPGMKILQFAFGSKMERKFLPHNHIKNCVVYTGSHDNDTTRGYFEKTKYDNTDVYKSVQDYLNYYGDDITPHLIRNAYSSVADLIIIPMQDILNLGSEARMNFPGKLGGNWSWRFTWEMVHPETVNYYKYLCNIYERPPVKREDEESV